MTSNHKIIRVLFVCLGNICRSPMAEAVFRSLVQEAGLADQIDVESAGTGSWHIGDRPHSGTVAVLAKNGIDVGEKRARRLSRSDLSEFDYIVAMDEENVLDIESLFGRKTPRLLEFAPQGMLAANHALNVPDPYYANNFDLVYRLVRAGCQGLLEHIRRREGI